MKLYQVTQPMHALRHPNGAIAFRIAPYDVRCLEADGSEVADIWFTAAGRPGPPWLVLRQAGEEVASGKDY